MASSVIVFNVTEYSVLGSMTWNWSPGKETKGLCFVQYFLRVVAELQDEIRVTPIFTGESHSD